MRTKFCKIPAMMRHDQDLEDDEEFEKTKENALQDEPVIGKRHTNMA